MDLIATISATGTGQEEIARAVVLLFASKLSAALQAEAAAWTQRDVDLEAVLQQGTPLPVVVEDIAVQRMYLGHRPSLIGAPIHAYPNLSVLCDASGQLADAQLDQVWSRNCDLAVELMVKAGPYDQDDSSGAGEDLANRRIQRTVNAVLAVLAAGPRTLGGLVEEIPAPVTVRISDVFVRREEKSRGPRWFWQGARLELAVSKIERAY